MFFDTNFVTSYHDDHDICKLIITVAKKHGSFKHAVVINTYSKFGVFHLFQRLTCRDAPISPKVTSLLNVIDASIFHPDAAVDNIMWVSERHRGRSVPPAQPAGVFTGVGGSRKHR